MNKFGYISGGSEPITYQIGESSIPLPSGSVSGTAQSTVLVAQSVGKYLVWPNGKDNLDPNECEELISANRLLPSLIEKQISILYGNGPKLYTQEITDDGQIIRHYVKNARIEEWLDSWKERGLADSFEEYINKCIRSYYYSEGIFSKWITSRAEQSGVKVAGAVRIAGLEHINELRCRFATRNRKMATRTDVEDRDFDLVLVGNWAGGNIQSEYRVYPRLNYMDPVSKGATAVSYSKNPNHGQDIYATNVFFKGLKDWLEGCNATPSYINSFLENALSVRHHVIIPEAWIQEKRTQLQEACEENARRQSEGKPKEEWITVTFGREKFEIGTQYSETILDKYVAKELQKMTEWLSGRGKNQGKLYATRSLMNGSGDIEKWEIVPVDQKYKEYIEALLSYDKRADMVLLSSKGIDSSISNVSADGTVSKSGSDAYYNYIIYLAQQSIPENVVCRDINFALKINFPDEYRQGIRLGFYRPTVQRQEEVSPASRMANQTEQ